MPYNISILVRVDLPWVRQPHFSYGSSTLVLSTWVPHPHFLAMKFLHQKEILLSLVHFHSDIRYKNYEIFKDVSFINLDVTAASLRNYLNLEMEKKLQSDNAEKN